MKTFILSAYNRCKRYAETTDIKSKLCNRTWIVFNDGGERELYKFREDGTIYIILSGCATKGTWEYDPSDKSMIITAANQSYMVHPGMHEDILMALQIDGTEECAFLIDENNALKFAPKTRTELIQYFENKEQKKLQEKQKSQSLEAKWLLVEALRLNAQEKERVEAKRIAQEKKQKKDYEIALCTRFKQYLDNNGFKHLEISQKKKKDNIGCLNMIIFLLIIILPVCIMFEPFDDNYYNKSFFEKSILFFLRFIAAPYLLLFIQNLLIRIPILAALTHFNDKRINKYFENQVIRYESQFSMSLNDKEIVNKYVDQLKKDISIPVDS